MTPPRNPALLRPEADAPLDTWVLVVHKRLGLIEARKDSDMVQDRQETKDDYSWDSPADPEHWLYYADILGWLPHPLAQVYDTGTETGPVPDSLAMEERE